MNSPPVWQHIIAWSVVILIAAFTLIMIMTDGHPFQAIAKVLRRTTPAIPQARLVRRGTAVRS